MALVMAGYWPTTYWPKDYWPADYWPEYAAVTQPNYLTATAITDNLEAIIVAQGLQLEDLTTDKSAATQPLCQVWIEGTDYEETHGERPGYNEIRYALEIKLRKSTPDASRDAQLLWPDKIRGAVKINTLNVGSLAASKLVSRVEHDNRVQYDGSASEITHRLVVRYREQ